MLGKWDNWYKGLKKEGDLFYGEMETYYMAAELLSDIKTVEDWGCGVGGFKKFYKGKYIGIDGSKTPFTDKIADLRKYTSKVDGILMRHVLEHNYDWEKVLKNAIKSFKKKMVLILFTPFVSETKEIAHNLQYGVDVPDIAFNPKDIEKNFVGCDWKLISDIPARTGYGIEHVYYLVKSKK